MGCSEEHGWDAGYLAFGSLIPRRSTRPQRYVFVPHVRCFLDHCKPFETVGLISLLLPLRNFAPNPSELHQRLAFAII